MQHVQYVGRMSNEIGNAGRKRERDWNDLPVLLIRWYRYCMRVKAIHLQIRHQQAADTINAANIAFTHWMLMCNQSRKVKRMRLKMKEKQITLAKRKSFVKWMGLIRMKARSEKISVMGRRKAHLRCVSSFMAAWVLQTKRAQAIIISCLRYASRRFYRTRSNIMRRWRSMVLVETMQRLSVRTDDLTSAKCSRIFMSWKLTSFANKTFDKLEQFIVKSQRKSRLTEFLRGWEDGTRFRVVRCSNKHFFSTHHEQTKKIFILLHLKMLAAHARAAKSSSNFTSFLLQLRLRHLLTFHFLALRMYARMVRRERQLNLHNFSVIEPNRKVCSCVMTMTRDRRSDCVFQVLRLFRLWKEFTDQRLMLKFVHKANDVKQKYHDAMQDCSQVLTSFVNRTKT
eukprot:754068-Hanusia_phi.AAC.5